MKCLSPSPALALMLVAQLVSPAPAQTEGSATFRVTTVEADQRYDPRHVLAIWVADAQNRFVKTLKKRASRREEYLYTWVARSNRNVVDAVTGATLSSHQTHTVTWDGRDTSGHIAPDGEYRIWVEFTAAHEQGPRTSVQFTKGPGEFTVSPPNQNYFRNMTLTYGPEIEVNTLVAARSDWKYHDGGIDLHGSGWEQLTYNDASWDEGPGKLGYGDAAATTLSFGPDADNKYPCYYFRHKFQADFVPTSLKVRVLRDDGVVVYLNGEEALRDNMDSGPVAYSDLASGTAGGADESSYFEFYIEPTLIVRGQNIIAAEVHQADVDSSDVGFDLELKAGPPAGTPTIALGQVDDFQDGTTMGWQSGGDNPNPPVQVSDGGPAGAGDGYLLIRGSGVDDSGGKITAFNTEQWRGDYIGEGVTMITADLKNFSDVPLEIRLRIEGPDEEFVSLESISLPAMSDWTSAAFLLGPEDLTGGTDPDGTLSEVVKIRFFHNPDPDTSGPPTDGQLGIDNITASEHTGGQQIPGDCNQDGRLDISDGVCLLLYLFQGGLETLPCGDGTIAHSSNVKLLDSNGDAHVDLSDSVRIFGALFLGDPPPVLGSDCVALEECPALCVQ